MQNRDISTLTLSNLPVSLKNLFVAILILLTIGVTVGLIYLFETTSFSAEGTLSRYNGELVKENEIPSDYPKQLDQMLLTTHNHLLGFAFIFTIICTLFWFNSVVPPFWTHFFCIEPFISVIFTFGSLWLMRFVHADFVYLTMISAILTYFSYYFITFVLLYELIFKD
jgi:hypothetical protein